MADPLLDLCDRIERAIVPESKNALRAARALRKEHEVLLHIFSVDAHRAPRSWDWVAGRVGQAMRAARKAAEEE